MVNDEPECSSELLGCVQFLADDLAKVFQRHRLALQAGPQCAVDFGRIARAIDETALNSAVACCNVYRMRYNHAVIEIQQTETFRAWLVGLRDKPTAAIIMRRIDRVRAGLLGDVKPVGEGISELRVDHGPGYRVYFVKRGSALIVLLCGGDKATQDRDIKAAKKLAANL